MHTKKELSNAYKKELSNAYKSTYRAPGVMAIRNLVNGKVFIDGSLDIEKLPNRFNAELNNNGHTNKALQAEWNEFGADNFIFEILEKIKEDDDINFNYVDALNTLKNSWMQELSPYGDKGYHK